MDEAEFKCNYWRCDIKSNTLNQSYVYPNLKVKIQCAECDKMWLEDQKYALNGYHKHLYSYDCDHCHKNFPGDSVMYTSHLNMCKAPCGGHPLCPCKL